MFYNFTRKELKNQNGTDFKDKDTINIADSHFEIWIKFGEYNKPSMCSTIFDTNKSKFQDVTFRPDYIKDFLRR